MCGTASSIPRTTPLLMPGFSTPPLSLRNLCRLSWTLVRAQSLYTLLVRELIRKQHKTTRRLLQSLLKPLLARLIQRRPGRPVNNTQATLSKTLHPLQSFLKLLLARLIPRHPERLLNNTQATLSLPTIATSVLGVLRRRRTG